MGTHNHPRSKRHVLLLAGLVMLCGVVIGLHGYAAQAGVATPPECNPGPILIPDNTIASPYPSIIKITEGGVIARVRVSITGLTHTYPDDVDILLVSPTGGTVLLMSDAGGNLDVVGVDITFDDAGPPLPNTGQITSGNYRPTNYVGNDVTDVFPPPAPVAPYGADLASLNGSDSTGIWSLYVIDDQGEDVGSIAGGWCLDITMTSPTATSTPTQDLTSPTPTEDLISPTPYATATHIATGSVTPLPTSSGTSTSTSTGTRTNTPISSATATRTSGPTATPTPCFNAGAISGNITSTDPTQNGRLSRNGIVSTCDTPKTCPSIFDQAGRHYDAYSFTNNTGSEACFTVRINAMTCVEARFLFSEAYLGSYNPQDLCVNYLADIGASPNPNGEYSFGVPAGATFVVVVHELDQGAGCPGYTLTVTTCPPPPACTIQFADVPDGSTFYDFVRCLACADILNGYPCGSPGEPCLPPTNYPYFRPNSPITRAQLSKVVSNAAGFSEPVAGQTFEDVRPGSTFHDFVERLAARDIIGGYACGGPGEPCMPPTNRSYFRPGANITRGQTAKIVADARNLPTPPSGQQTFQDVPENSTFWPWIEALASTGSIAGYPCGGPGEPCVPPDNRPYFRPGNNVSRGQAAKIVSTAFFPGCDTGHREQLKSP